jgi:hypothetical protein
MVLHYWNVNKHMILLCDVRIGLHKSGTCLQFMRRKLPKELEWTRFNMLEWNICRISGHHGREKIVGIPSIVKFVVLLQKVEMSVAAPQKHVNIG